MAKFTGTLSLANHPPWLEKRASTNKKARHFKKGQDSKHSHKSPANKDSDNIVNLEDEKKDKGPENPKKKAC